MTSESLLGPQLYGLEPHDVLAVKEHEAHGGTSLVYLNQSLLILIERDLCEDRIILSVN